MWIFEQLKKQKEQNENLALKRQLLEKYKTWEISKHEYECALMDMQLSQEEKEYLLKDADIDYLFTYTEKTEHFVEEIIIKKLGARIIVVGENHANLFEAAWKESW